MTASIPNVSAPASGAMLCAYPTQRKASAMKTKTKLRRRSTLAHALIPALLGAALVATAGMAQETRLQQAQKNADDILGLYDAEARKTELCKSYVGQVVKPAAFAALAAQLSSPAPKGEFETTAQYNARVAAARQPVPEGPVIITLPTDREFISYNADTGAMFVQAGAFGAGKFSDIVDVQVTADYFGLVPKELATGSAIPHSMSERQVRTYTARTGLGLEVKVSEIERQSNGLYISSPKLFPFAKSNRSAVAFLEAKPPQAQQLKLTLKVALALLPKAPYVFRTEQPGAAPTARSPVQYEDKLTALYGDAKCALVLDSANRVLASVDAGA